MRILAFDIGSSSIKAGYWNGRIFQTRIRIPFKTNFNGPAVEIATATLTRALLRAGKEALKGATPDAIAFCTFSPGVLITDAHYRPLTPIITHADRRSTATAAALVQKHPKSWWLARTGNLPYPGGIGSSTLAWLRQNRATLFHKPYRIGQVSTFITSLLTGQWLIDPSQAAFLGLYDIRTARWSTDVCQTLRISPDALPEIRPADSILGTLTHTLARHWKIPTGIPILGSLVDTSAAIIQTPMHPGQLTHSAGSTDVLAMCVKNPAPAEGLLTRPVGTSHAFPNRWLAVRTLASAGSGLQWARDTLFSDATDAQWAKLTRTAAKAPTTDQSPQCHPTVAGERASLRQPPRPSFSKIRLSTTPEQLLAAIIQGLVAESTHSYQLLAKIHPPARTVFTMGGASALGDAMHAAWPAHPPPTYQKLTGDGLRGLVLLAQHTLAHAR